MRMNSGLIASMEEIENIDPTVVVEETPEAITAVAVADESSEIQADSDEIGITVSQVEDAVQAGEELEDIADVASEAVESGEGMDEKTAEVASIAIESIRNRLGVYEATRLVPVRESFGNVNTKLISTKLVIEEIGDFVKKIWTAIKQAALRIWEMLRSFFAKLFNSATLLKKNIDALKARANAMPGTAVPKEATIKSSIAKTISVKGKADMNSFKAILKNTQALATSADSINKAAFTIASAATTLGNSELTEANVKTFLTAEEAGANKIASIASSSFSGISGAFSDNELPAPDKFDAKGGKITWYGPFAGNTALGVLTGEKENVKQFGLFFQAANVKTAEAVDALSLAEVKEVLNASGELANKLMEFKKVQGDVDNITKSVAKTADVVMANAAKVLSKKEASKDVTTGLGNLKASVNDLLKLLQSFSNKAPTYVFNLAKAGSDYASISMRNLGEKQPEAAK